MNIGPRGFRFSREGDRTTHDEKFFELFSFDSYIHIIVFFLFITIIHYDEKFIVLSMLKYNEIFKTLYLLLCYVYIVFLYIMCFSPFLSILSI